MATAVDIICGICDARHTNKAADYWCRECDEGLCSECQKDYHSVSKGTRNHDVIDIANYKKLPSSVLGITNHCTEHNMKYQNYCPNHEALCCPVCISSIHKTCNNLMAVSELIKTSKSSTLLESIEQGLLDLKTNIENIIQDRQQNLSKLRQERLKINAEIKRIRDQINSHLDTLEQKIVTDLLTAEDKSTRKIETLLEKLEVKKKNVEELESATVALKHHASDMQTFFGTKEINRDIENEEKNMKSLFEDGSLEQLTLKCNIDDKISDVLSSITSFGSVTIESAFPSASLKVGRSKEAQIMSIIKQPSPKPIQEIKLNLVNTFTIPRNVRGCTICPDGKIMFVTDSIYKLIIMNGNGTTEKELSISSCPFDVTMIDDKTVAVTTGKGIYIININTEQTERYIKTTDLCHGVYCSNDKLFWCEADKGIQMFHISGNNISTFLKQTNLPNSSYLAGYSDRIYQTNLNNKSVTCYTTKGDKIWEFRDDSFQYGPIGVTVDNDHNVYITTNWSHSVVVLSPDGKQSRKLLSQSDGLDRPWGICFDNNKNNILVTNLCDRKAFLYNIN